MSTLLWIMACWFVLDLFIIVAWAAKRKVVEYTPALAAVHFVSYGFFVAVCVIAATKGVTP